MMFVDSLAFVVTMSRDIKFIRMHYIISRTSEDLAESLKETICLYQHRGFKVQILLLDKEFKKFKKLNPSCLRLL
ncbi:hypothetical protein ACHAXS_000319 [Conticribra weissflogii]